MSAVKTSLINIKPAFIEKVDTGYIVFNTRGSFTTKPEAQEIVEFEKKVNKFYTRVKKSMVQTVKGKKPIYTAYIGLKYSSKKEAQAVLKDITR